MTSRSQTEAVPLISISAGRQNRHLFVTFATVLLIFTYIPHEFVPSGPNISWVSLVISILLAVRFRLDNFRATAVERIAVLFAVWILLRLTVLAPLNDEGIDFPAALASVAPLVAGVIYFRLARIADLRPAIARGLIAGLIIMLSFETWQVLAGTARLQSLGYTTDRGFNYYTEAGQMRPFGTLLSPTVFAGYLVVVAVVAIAHVHKRFPAVLLAVWFVTGLALTQTRAAWLAFIAQALIFAPLLPPRLRRALVPWLIPAAIGAAILAILGWDVLEGLWARLSSVTDSSYHSNTVREDLWSGVFQSVASQPLIGRGAEPFADVLFPFIGPDALYGHAHSNYLEQLYLYGWVGMLLFILLIGAMALHVVSTGRGLVRVAGVAGVVAFSIDSLFEATWQGFIVAVGMFLVVGLTGGPFAPSSAAAEGRTRPLALNRTRLGN